MSLLPMIQPTAEAPSAGPTLCREVAWDCARNIPVWRGGSPYIVTGVQAVLSWAFRALQTPRFRHAIYTRNYGNECESLIGSAYTDELRQAEAARCVRECLLANRHITGVSQIRVEFSAGRLEISCVLETMLGEVKVNV